VSFVFTFARKSWVACNCGMIRIRFELARSIIYRNSQLKTVRFPEKVVFKGEKFDKRSRAKGALFLIDYGTLFATTNSVV